MKMVTKTNEWGSEKKLQEFLIILVYKKDKHLEHYLNMDTVGRRLLIIFQTKKRTETNNIKRKKEKKNKEALLLLKSNTTDQCTMNETPLISK